MERFCVEPTASHLLIVTEGEEGGVESSGEEMTYVMNRLFWKIVEVRCSWPLQD